MQREVLRQIQLGKLVCPSSKKRLIHTGETTLSTADRSHAYEVLRGVPILVKDRASIEGLSQESAQMTAEYAAERKESWFARYRQRDYRNPASLAAKASIFENLPTDAVCISIGGGPHRSHPRLLNVNIAPFPNVEIVGDAHELPYADASVDAIHCDAVLEHLPFPAVAVREMHRVLKHGGKVFACTPFLQPYHGYPHHYQNFTLTGHVHLFKTAGFNVIESGACVGPLYAIRSLTSVFLATYLPKPLNKITHACWAAFSLLIAPLDRIFSKRSDGHELASTTYLVAHKG